MQLQWLLDHGYRVCSLDDFVDSCTIPGLVERAMEYVGKYVVYDPNNDAKGFLLVGTEPNQLCVMAWERLAD